MSRLQNLINQPRVVKKHPRFGMIHAPRTRLEKLRHLEIIGSVPLEMAAALQERNTLRGESSNQHVDPIASIVFKHQFSPISELISAMCKALASRELDRSIWSMFSDRITELLPDMSAADSGILLKCLILCPPGTMDNPSKLAIQLIERIFERSAQDRKAGQYTLLYGLQGLVRFSASIDSKSRTRYFHALMRSIRLSSMSLPVLISTVQGISKLVPEVSEAIIAPLLSELVSRTEGDSQMELPSWCGLVSSLARLPKSKENRQLYSILTSKLIKDESFILESSIEQLSGLVFAYSRLGAAVLTDSREVFVMLGKELRRCPREEWTCRIFSVTVHAFGKAAVLHGDLFEYLRTEVAKHVIPQLNSMQLVMARNGLSRLGIIDDFEHIFPQFQLR